MVDGVRRDPLFKAGTRPALFLGIPLMMFIFTSGVITMVAFWAELFVGNVAFLVTLSLLAPVLTCLHFYAKPDPFRFRLLYIKLTCRVFMKVDRNRRFWKATSYSPLAFKRREE